MKTKIIITTIALGLMSVTAVNAQTTEKAKADKSVKTETFKVYGNCGMCKTRIEKAAKSIKGVKSAKWNGETAMITVSWDESKNSLDAISNAIATVGHDTKWNSAKEEVYNKLPGCCQYERKDSDGGKKEMKGHEGHNH